MKGTFEMQVRRLMGNGKLSRSEACSILGKRGSRSKNAKSSARIIIHDRVNVEALPDDFQKLGRGDIVECMRTRATYTVLDGLDAKGVIMTEDAQGIIHPLRADRVKIIAITSDNTPITAEQFAEAWAS